MIDRRHARQHRLGAACRGRRRSSPPGSRAATVAHASSHGVSPLPTITGPRVAPRRPQRADQDRGGGRARRHRSGDSTTIGPSVPATARAKAAAVAARGSATLASIPSMLAERSSIAPAPFARAFRSASGRATDDRRARMTFDDHYSMTIGGEAGDRRATLRRRQPGDRGRDRPRARRVARASSTPRSPPRARPSPAGRRPRCRAPPPARRARRRRDRATSTR